MNSWRFFVPLAIFAAFLGVAAWQLTQPKDEFVHSAMVGKPIPAFAMRPAASDRPGLKLADLKDGKPKLLNIWASWCVPCAAEAPQLAALKAQGAPIVGVAIRDRPEDVAAFLARYGNPFDRIGADDLSELQLAIGSSGVPETFVVDGQGVIRYQHIGDIRESHVPILLEKLAEAGE
ncbi:DsbE family thiol:disulfide interchange protein [Parafrankia sp. BMG5.11]|uniref:DsbE family thiol:disulfide interchange protein n=1 Tax=Parafrankia sp. BMG5.11 TaxID=222540 RepID=UPI00103BB26E|nr:DsbE family thiol:disulfide interchange protein [Parafrankia sp. BMG5.11]TCJ39053.1 DsbE family thiol:disulfide interchange protein [Parafrankia sp. BMG5.11]